MSRARIHTLLQTAGVAIVATALLTLTPAHSGAQEYTAARKVGRGVAGMTLGVLEIPGNMVAMTRESGPAMGIPLGFAVGLGKFVVRELVGVYEFVSAPFAAPAGYEPILEPEFPWDYFESEPGYYGYLSDELRNLEQIPGVVVYREAGALRVRVPDLLFETGRSDLTPGAAALMRDVASALRNHPGTQVAVQGYTDSTGVSRTNQWLSEARASAVRDQLVRNGVAANRVTSMGFGADSPIASNTTSEGRQINRRVEIELRAGGVASR
jgi:putative exosortase-associated protein (TIGR04073 family)